MNHPSLRIKRNNFILIGFISTLLFIGYIFVLVSVQKTKETSRLSPEQLALTPVVRNEEWTPVEREIDGVMRVLVAPGCFMMGSNNGEDNEKPSHEQCLDYPFWIDKYEVSRKQYQGCIDAGECIETPSSNYSIQLNQPINRVTWLQAKGYCEWHDGRLPTEVEWEYVARGPNNLIYPWGNDFVAEYGVYLGNSNNQTALVGSRESGASWVGAMDMSGNVSEWTNSSYKNYPYVVDDGQVPHVEGDKSVLYVLRGGSFSHDLNVLRASYRYSDDVNSEYITVGFRCYYSYP